jgi:hypothetical protein
MTGRGGGGGGEKGGTGGDMKPGSASVEGEDATPVDDDVSRGKVPRAVDD